MARLELFLSGDVMTGRGVDQILPHPSEPRIYEDYLRDARDYVKLAELTNGPIPRPVPPSWIWGDLLQDLERRSPDARIINLETSVTVSDLPWPGKGIHYRMHPANVDCLTVAKIDVCVLANNHVLDWGREGLVETLEVLHGVGIRTAGAGCTANEAEDVAIVGAPGEPRVLVAALAHPSSGVPPSWAAGPDRPGVALVRELSEDDAEAAAERLASVRRPDDVAVVSIHWGSNWGHEIPDEHVRFAHTLVDRGVDVVHGHSSHHPRAVEIYRGRPIFYGCGDLVSDYEGITGYEPFCSDRVLAWFVSIGGSRVAEVRMLPFRLRRMRLERASAADVSALVDALATASHPFDTIVATAAGGHLVARPRG